MFFIYTHVCDISQLPIPIAMEKSPSPFSFLWQALLLPSRNPKLSCRILLIYFLSHAVLYNGLRLSTTPLVSKITECSKLLPTIDPSSPQFTELVNTMKTVVKELFIVEIIYCFFLFVLSCFLSIITYYAISATYLGEMLTLKELLSKVKGIIKGLLVTQFFVALFGLVYLASFSAIIGAISWYISSSYKISSLVVVIPFTLFASLLLIYLAIIWSMGIAISVIEPTIYGIHAISHATKLLQGKKMQVFLLALSLTFVSGIIYGCNAIIARFASGSMVVSLLQGFLYLLVGQVITLYNMMAVTVLYYECNQRNRDVVDKVEYIKLATTNIV